MDKSKTWQETLDLLGEDEILKRISRYVPPGQIDDDTAQIKGSNKELLINTDVFVDGIHFSQETTEPIDIGWRVVAANVSDLIASGLDELIGITVALITPPKTKWSWVEGVYEGMNAALENYGGIILGGDCSKGDQKILSVTAIGSLGKLRIHRSHAVPGDHLIVSGPHGLSRLGLALLLKEPLIKEQQINKVLKEQAMLAHKKPKPSVEILRALEECKPKGIPWRAGGSDSSDGLIAAIESICNSSKCKALINKDFLPKADYWPKGSHWDDWCINGGEDFEMVLCLPPEWAFECIKTIPCFKHIGKIEEGTPSISWSDNHKKIEVNKYKHF